MSEFYTSPEKSQEDLEAWLSRYVDWRGQVRPDYAIMATGFMLLAQELRKLREALTEDDP